MSQFHSLHRSKFDKLISQMARIQEKHKQISKLRNQVENLKDFAPEDRLKELHEKLDNLQSYL